MTVLSQISTLTLYRYLKIKTRNKLSESPLKHLPNGWQMQVYLHYFINRHVCRHGNGTRLNLWLLNLSVQHCPNASEVLNVALLKSLNNSLLCMCRSCAVRREKSWALIFDALLFCLRAGMELMDDPCCLCVSVLFIKVMWERERKRRRLIQAVSGRRSFFLAFYLFVLL